MTDWITDPAILSLAAAAVFAILAFKWVRVHALLPVGVGLGTYGLWLATDLSWPFLVFGLVLSVLSVFLLSEDGFENTELLVTGVSALTVVVLVASLLPVAWSTVAQPWNWFDDDGPSMTAADGEQAQAAGPEEPTTTTTTTTPTEDLGLSEEDARQVAEELSGIYEGFEPEELKMGASQIPESPEERSATASFTKNTIQTREDLEKFFASDHPKAKPARARVEKALREAGYGDDEVEQALTSGARWIWVAPTVEHQILGTTYLLNGDIVKADSWRQVAPNDAIWFYVTSDAKIVQGAAVRADCGNPGLDKARPVRPGMPKAPPVEQPPTVTQVPKCTDDVSEDDGFCGTPNSGPEQQPVQDNDPDHVAPTPGYEAGEAEETTQNQEDAANDGKDEPSPDGEPAPDSGASPGTHKNPDGSTESGTSDGVSDPDDQDGYSEDEPATGDPGGF